MKLKFLTLDIERDFEGLSNEFLSLWQAVCFELHFKALSQGTRVHNSPELSILVLNNSYYREFFLLKNIIFLVLVQIEIGEKLMIIPCVRTLHMFIDCY